MPEPVLTIITPTLNRAPLLEEAIRSVLAQDVAGVEHIVIDAMSTDGTVEMLARYPHLRVLREPDVYLADDLGSTMALVNASGAVQNSYTYDVYGKPTKPPVRRDGCK